MTEGDSFRWRARSCWEISKVERHFLIVDPGFAERVISPAIFSASSVRIGDRRGGRNPPVFDDFDLPKFISAIGEENRPAERFRSSKTEVSAGATSKGRPAPGYL